MMTTLSRSRRRAALYVARAAAAFSLAMLLLGTVTAWNGHRHASAASGLTAAGAVRFYSIGEGATEIFGGGSGITFNMLPPSGAACSGTATGTPSYRWQTFIVPATLDIGALKYNSEGPITDSSIFAYSLYAAQGASAVVDRNPALLPPGLIGDIPSISFVVFAGEFAPPADSYLVGFACTADGSTEKFWATTITFKNDAKDTPNGFTWVVGTGQSDQTTTTTTTAGATTTTSTTVASTSTTTTVKATTTTTAGTTTTTTAGATTTTVAGSATTTATGSTTSTTAVVASSGVGSGTTSSTSSTRSSLPSTGWSPTHLLFWAIMLVAFGRAAVLLGRPVAVRETPAR